MRHLPQLTAALVCAAALTSPSFATAQPVAAPQLIEGPSNTAVGQGALAVNTTGVANTAVGVEGLSTNDTGFGNSSLGYAALRSNVNGGVNTAAGTVALYNNVSGNANVAIGDSAMFGNIAGSDNVAVGNAALYAADGLQNTAIGNGALSTATGYANTAVGYGAGSASSTGWFNVYLGTVNGDAADANTMRLGQPSNGAGAGQSRTFIAGITGTALTAPAVPVYIDANGQLGTVVPTAPPGATFPIAPAAAALQQTVQAQAATIATLQRELAALRARLTRLERASPRR